MSSTPLFGVIGEFDPSTELFTAYLERLEQYFIANSIGQCSADATQDVLRAADKKKSGCFYFCYGQNASFERTAHHQVRSFLVGEHVWVRNYSGREKWVRGVISKVLGSRHYMVKVPGYVWKRHVDQLLKDDSQDENDDSVTCDDSGTSTEKPAEQEAGEPSDTTEESENAPEAPVNDGTADEQFDRTNSSDGILLGRRYPLRANRGKSKT